MITDTIEQAWTAVLSQLIALTLGSLPFVLFIAVVATGFGMLFRALFGSTRL